MNDIVAPVKGMFLGSQSALFPNQTQADIYLSNAWQTAGVLKRVAISTVHWGLSVVHVQSSWCQQAGLHGQFNTNAAYLDDIQVEDMGEAPLADYFLPHLNADKDGPFIVNGVAIEAHCVLWHCRSVLTSLLGNRVLHFHKHERRKDHGPIIPKILPEGPKRHITAHKLSMGTQVQNFRRFKTERLWPVPVLDNEEQDRDGEDDGEESKVDDGESEVDDGESEVDGEYEGESEVDDKDYESEEDMFVD